MSLALITGASRGIGAAIARELASNGYDVVVNYRNDEHSAKLVKGDIEKLGQKAWCMKADISEQKDVNALFRFIDTLEEPLSILVNNAGVLMKQGRLIDFSVERINKVLAVNVTGSILCAQQAIRRMAISTGGQGGNIVNISSGAARLGSAFEYIDYAASKGAVDTFTIGLANEVADEGIRVNCVRPGLIYTDMHSSGGDPNRVDRLKHNLPLKKGGQPEDVAAAISYLVSDSANYVTGAFIDVTGGR